MKQPGATYLGNNRCRFRVWAPESEAVDIQLTGNQNRTIPLIKQQWGYFEAEADEIPPGTLYRVSPAPGKQFPDPASAYQPEGVHGPSAVVDQDGYHWSDAGWRGQAFRDLIIYELHVGTFTPEGTFEAIIPRLADLKETGINALEIMPVAQFPGNRNWGYDGVYPFAVQHSYGGPDGFKRLIDACHAKGISVILDVVYNHFGPEGNYISEFGPYFTQKYCTPWGNALNFDGTWADGVRDYFVSNVRYWFETFHLDGLRFDAIHEVYDFSATHIWELIHDETEQLRQTLGRPLYLIAESDLNSPKVVKHPETGGFGFTAQWLDDFHHALYVLVDPAGRDRYRDFGRIEQLAKAYTDGFVVSGEFVSFRKRKFGRSTAGMDADKFVVFSLNHDQVGNRVGGERLSKLVNSKLQKLSAAAVLLSPYVPMLFMGEEYGDEAPFYYFVDHSDPDLIKAVQEGRKSDFAAFGNSDYKDPFDEDVYRQSVLNWDCRHSGKHAELLAWHKALLTLRQEEPALQNVRKDDIRFSILDDGGFVLHRQCIHGLYHILAFFNLSRKTITAKIPAWIEEPAILLHSGDKDVSVKRKQLSLEPWQVVVISGTSSVSE